MILAFHLNSTCTSISEQQDGRREISQALSDLRRTVKSDENEIKPNNERDVRERMVHGSTSPDYHGKPSDENEDGMKMTMKSTIF